MFARDAVRGKPCARKPCAGRKSRTGSRPEAVRGQPAGCAREAARDDSSCRDSPVACLYSLLKEQRHEFKTRRWLTPHGIDPTTEQSVTTPRGQPPQVTSTSASCPLRESGPPRPRSRVEDTNGPPARRRTCKLRPTRRVGGPRGLVDLSGRLVRPVDAETSSPAHPRSGRAMPRHSRKAESYPTPHTGPHTWTPRTSSLQGVRSRRPHRDRGRGSSACASSRVQAEKRRSFARVLAGGGAWLAGAIPAVAAGAVAGKAAGDARVRRRDHAPCSRAAESSPTGPAGPAGPALSGPVRAGEAPRAWGPGGASARRARGARTREWERESRSRRAGRCTGPREQVHPKRPSP
jgi:hypothetical protein